MKNFILYTLLICFLFSCSKEPGDLKTPNEADSGLALSVIHDNVPADGYSYVELSATVDKITVSTDQLIFVADRGTFANGKASYSVPVNSSGSNTAYLKYNKAEKVHVTASLGDKVSREVSATFTTAYPNQILLSSDSTVVNAYYNSLVPISAQLLRPFGKVSEGIQLTYYDSTVTGRSIGSFFKNTFSNNQGQSTVSYSIQDTSYHGFVYIKGFVQIDTVKVIGINRIYIR